jgi:hypothetical protein
MQAALLIILFNPILPHQLSLQWQNALLLPVLPLFAVHTLARF